MRSSELRGNGIGRGLAIGTVLRMPDALADALPGPSDVASELTPDVELARADASIAATVAQLRRRGESAGGASAQVLTAQALMVADPALRDDIGARIRHGSTAEHAVFGALATFRDLLVGLGGYSAQRAADLDDLSQRVVAHLRGVAVPGVPEPGHPFILVARDLAPADVALLDLDVVQAIVTADGGPTSHTAILARERSVVAVVGVHGCLELNDGDTVIVDAAKGTVTVSPTPAGLGAAEAALAGRSMGQAGDLTPGALADGTRIELLANLGAIDGLAEARALGAEGVGLFRTELLFLDAHTEPTVAEQQQRYTALFAAFDGMRVVVRAFDSGADKPLRFLADASTASSEPNPALGLRGLRALRANGRILENQLTAIARAAALSAADVWVMAPMVSTVEEARFFTELARRLGVRTAGVMIEVPAAALLVDRVLAHADFASIGTNDLIQYTLAADRQLGAVASLQDPWHPAVLTLIGQVGRAGAEAGKPVGVCGEAAADPALAVVLVGLGVTSLSMSPSALAPVRSELARFTLTEARRFADLALAADGGADARTAVLDAMHA